MNLEKRITNSFKDKELLFLRAFLFFLPYRLGVGAVEDRRLLYLSDIFLYLTLLMWFMKTRGFQRGKIFLGPTLVPAVLMIIWGSISVLFAISQALGAVAVFLLIKAVLIYIYMINRVNTRAKLKLVVHYLMIGIAIQGVIGIAQRATGGPLGLDRLGESMGTMLSNIGRVVGTYYGPNRYAAHLILLIPISVSLFMFLKKRNDKYFYGTVSMLSLAGLFFSLSRSSWAGTILALFLMLIVLGIRGRISPRLLKAIMIVFIAILIIGAVFWNTIERRFERAEDGDHRITMINIAFQLLQDHYIFGVGLFNYQFHSFHLFAFWHPVHNCYLRLAVETGIPGLLFFLWFVFYIIRASFRGTKIKDPFLSSVSLGCLGGLFAFLAAVNFGPMYQHYRMKAIFWIVGALAIAVRRIYKNEQIANYKMKMQKEDEQQKNVQPSQTKYIRNR